MSRVIVAYSGKRCPWTIEMPWLTEKPVKFGNSREADMVKVDAERLCAENPTDFKIVGESAEDKSRPEKPKPKKKAPAKNREPKKKPVKQEPKGE